MLRSHKIALDPNRKQATHFAKACGVARFAFNWGLVEWKRQYEPGEKPTQASLRRQLNAIKRERFPWVLEVTKNAPQMAIIHLGQAFQNFCSICGTKQDNMPLSIRKWTCPECGSHHDRDLNAANLAVSSTVTACGEDVRPAITGAASTKQEFNIKTTYE